MNSLLPVQGRFLLAASTLLIFLLSPAWPNEEKIQWVWTGGVTSTKASLSAQSLIPGPDVKLVLSSGPDRPDSEVPVLSSALLNHKHILRYQLSGLLPDTLYHYRFVSSDGKPLSANFSFKTFPPPEKTASFRFAFGSCNKQLGSRVFEAALNQKLLFFLHTGDFHYANIGDNNPATFHNVFQTHLQNPGFNTMLHSLPLFYMWDDHDFGPNDSNINNPSKEAAHSNYRALVPHFPLQVPGTIDQAFTVGRVRFILSDLRSERNPETRTMISEPQMDWLKKELLACKGRYPLIF